MTKIRMLLMLLVLAGCTTAVQPAPQQETGKQKSDAAEPAKLFADIERVFREKESDWKVERVRTDTESDTRKQSIVLMSEEGQAAVEVWVWKKEQDAHDTFAAEAKAFESGPGRAREKSSLPKLGDENHVWTMPGSTAWPTLKFRKGAANVIVFAPSTEVAERFARRVLEQLNAE